MKKSEMEYQFLLHEYDNAQEDVRVIGERRYSIIKFYFSIIIAIVSAIFIIYQWQLPLQYVLRGVKIEATNIFGIFFAILALIFGFLVDVLVYKEQINIYRTMNKINLIRKSMNLDLIKQIDAQGKNAIHMNTGPLLYEQRWNANKITSIMEIIIIMTSFCFWLYIVLIEAGIAMLLLFGLIYCVIRLKELRQLL